MVYRRRRTTYRRKRYSRNRTYRRKFRRGYRYNKRGQKIYLFKRTSNYGTLFINNITDTLDGYQFRLDQVPNFTEFTALYDQFKINAVKLTFYPQVTENISLGTINNPVASARFYSCLDFNDSAPPTTIDEVREYQSCKRTPILKPHKRYLKPRIMDRGQIYNPGRPWLSCDTARSEPHYGVKIGVENMSSTTTSTMEYTIECKFYLSFRNVK